MAKKTRNNEIEQDENIEETKEEVIIEEEKPVKKKKSSNFYDYILNETGFPSSDNLKSFVDIVEKEDGNVIYEKVKHLVNSRAFVKIIKAYHLFRK